MREGYDGGFNLSARAFPRVPPLFLRFQGMMPRHRMDAPVELDGGGGEFDEGQGGRGNGMEGDGGTWRGGGVCDRTCHSHRSLT